MKKLALLLFVLFSIGCNMPTINEKIENQIQSFYKQALPHPEAYTPLSFSAFDTTENILDDFRVTGKIIHTFKALSNDGELMTYKDTFEITVFKNKDVIVIPLDYER